MDGFRWIVAGVALAAAGCSFGGEEGEPEPYACGSTEGESPFELSMGHGDGDDYVEVAEGDDLPVVLGSQGLYMLVLEWRAELAVPSAAICFECDVEVTPVGVEQLDWVSFDEMPSGEYMGGLNVPLFDASERDELEGAEAEVTTTCRGHGFAASLTRGVRLQPE